MATIVDDRPDAFVPVEDVQKLATRLADATALIVPDAGHMVHQQRADWFSTAVLEWLASHGTMSAATAKNT